MDPFEAFEAKEENVEVDPAADFLAREQVELAKIEKDSLGDDGFGSNNDFSDFASQPTEQNNLFSNANDFNNFETNGQSAFSVEPVVQQLASLDVYSSISNVDRVLQEPETIKRWRDEQRVRIEAKDREEEVKKRELKEAAKRELEEWYKNRQEQLVKSKENNKHLSEAEHHQSQQSLFGDESSKSVEWDRITKHCDFNPKANKNNKDVTRFRSLLLQLKQQPLIR